MHTFGIVKFAQGLQGRCPLGPYTIQTFDPENPTGFSAYRLSPPNQTTQQAHTPNTCLALFRECRLILNSLEHSSYLKLGGWKSLWRERTTMRRTRTPSSRRTSLRGTRRRTSLRRRRTSLMREEFQELWAVEQSPWRLELPSARQTSKLASNWAGNCLRKVKGVSYGG